MATAMRRLIRRVGILVMISAIGLTVGGGAQVASASEGYAQWYGPYDNGCYYLADEESYYSAICALANGTVEVDQVQSGQWVAIAIVGYDTYGCFAAWINGQKTIYYCPPIVGTTLWGDYTITNYTPGPGYSTIGGDSLPTESFSVNLTGNALIDSINVASNYYDVGTWLQPRCVTWDGYVCLAST